MYMLNLYYVIENFDKVQIDSLQNAMNSEAIFAIPQTHLKI
jgi:hypothetical protein